MDSSPKRNWSGILDSSYALRKYFFAKQHIVAASSSEHATCPLNNDWQLASDLTDHSEPSPKKSTASLPKRVERKIWAKPSMVELTKAAVRTERAKASANKFHEKLLAMKTKPEKTKRPSKTERPEKPQKPQRPPLWQPKTVPTQIQQKPPAAVHRRRRSIKKSSAKKATKPSAINVTKPPKAEVSGKKTPSAVRRTRKPKAVSRWHSTRPSSILVVDAKTDPGLSRPNTGGAEQPMNSKGGQVARRSKKSYSVPLCNRPTKILGMGYPYSRQMQMRQQQLSQQPEYRDQYVRMLHRQQRQLEQYYGQPLGGSVVPDQQLMPVQHEKVYAVPAKPPLKALKMGKRLCGNFYYD